MISACARMLCAGAAVLLSAAAVPAIGNQLEGVSLPPTMSAAGQTLQLASCAQREMLWMEPYAISLYLPQQRTTAAYILDARTPKLVRLDVTYEGSTPDDIPSGWQERLQERLSQELYNVVQQVYSGLKTGDTVVFAYIPDQGTTVLVNGNPVKTTSDNQLVHALLVMFIGDDPVSKNMKRLLLQGGC